MQFRTTAQPGPTIQTYGKFPAYLDGCIPSPHDVNGLPNILMSWFWVSPGCITQQDADSSWTHRIIYVVSKAQYNAGLAYVRSQFLSPTLAQNGLRVGWITTVPFAVALTNCVGFAEGVATAAGLTLPSAYSGGLPGLGLSTPAPVIFDQNLATAGNGGMVNGGLVQASNGSTASGAVDAPTTSPDPGSVPDLVVTALSAPDTVASQFNLPHDTYSLSSASIAPGGSVQLSENDSPPQYAFYGVDWGDGTSPDMAVVSPDSPTGFVPSFTHTYTTAGAYKERLIVIDGALEEYDTSVTVALGSSSSGSQQFTVATPPTSYQLPPPPDLPTATFGPLAGAPEAPWIGTATASPGSATVSFYPPFYVGDSPITSYTVTALDSTTSSKGGQTTVGTASPITVSGLNAGDTYTFTVTASNLEGPGLSSDSSHSVGVPAAPVITLKPSIVSNATWGALYSTQFTTVGNVGKVTISENGTIPKGLALNSTTGLLSGTPTNKAQIGTVFQFSVTATDSVGNSVTINYTITLISPCGTGLTPFLLSASWRAGNFTGLFCVNAAGTGTYTQSGGANSTGTVKVSGGVTWIAANGRSLALLGHMQGPSSTFTETAPPPMKSGTFTLT